MQNVCLPLNLNLIIRENGKDILVGYHQKEVDLLIGSMISISHFGHYRDGTLRNPFYWRRKTTNPVLTKIHPQPNYQILSYANWTKSENCRKFFENLRNELGYGSLEELYKITEDNIRHRGGSILFDYIYGGSLHIALQSIYPDHHWLPWRFLQSLPKGYWDDINNRREFMDWLGKQLGYQKMDDWYRIDYDLVQNNGGSVLLTKHKDSLPLLVKSVYSQYNWMTWRFDKVPKGHWKSDEFKAEITNFVEWLSDKLQVRKLEDWKQISVEKINEIIPLDVFRKFSLEEMLHLVYNSRKQGNCFSFKNLIFQIL